MPLTVKNIKDAEAAAVLDLAWMVEEGLADKVDANGTAKGKNYFQLDVNLLKSGTSIFSYGFNTAWGAE
jgi:phage gp46-like protein